MAVLEMQHIYICALKKDRKHILEFLQRQGVIEISENITEDNIFHKTDVTAAKTVLANNINAAKEANHILDTFVPVKKPILSVLEGRSEVSSAVYDKFYLKHDTTLHKANKICTLNRQIDEHKAEILKLELQNEMLSPWTSLDIPMNFAGTKYTSGFIGTLPYACTQDVIYSKLEEYSPVSVEIISSSREQTCIFVICLKENSEAVSEALRDIGFSQATSAVTKAPADQRKEIEKQIAEAHSGINRNKEEIISLADFRDDLLFLEDFDTMRAEKYDVLGNLMQSRYVFTVTGYIPVKDKAELEEALSRKFEAGIEFDEPSDGEDVPVLLQNNGFAMPLEGTVESFSLPGRGEVDPTKAMSFFYYILFGLMLSDAAYGAIITIACAIGLLRYRKTIEGSTKNNLKMFLYCGIATIFWGVMFGSYFGDVIDVVSEVFFGKKVTIPALWFYPVNEPMRMLVFSMLIGIIHLYTGLGLKLYQCIRQRDIKAVLYDVVLWYILLTSSVIMLLSAKVFVDTVRLSFILPGMVGSIAGVFAGFSALGIILTNGRESRNPFKRFLKGLYALYGITGYLSDVLSYSRLLALGLATGVIGTVINKMAGMTAGTAIGPIAFTIIFVLGHTLNIGINVLGAYVHTTRLHYVEFFSKFYQGGGRKFTPFRVKTKYYRFREE